MRNTLRILVVVVILLLMTACTETKLEMLSDPQNIQVEKRVITWDSVENASGYLVTFDGEEYRTESTQLDIHQYMEEGTYLFTLIALGDGEQYANSVMVQERITLESVIQHGFDDQGFEYIFLKDAMGYEVNHGGADLSGMVTIPDFYGDYPVVRIADFMFAVEGAHTHWTKMPNCFTEKYCNTVTTGVELPAHLESIGKLAFAFMLNLQEVEIPDTVIEIGYGAFEGCKRLRKVKIPQNLKDIPGKCFRDTALSEIILPPFLEVIGDDAFSTVEQKYSEGTQIGNVYSDLAEIVITASVKHIGIRAFEGRRNLKTVILKDNVGVMLGSCFDDTAWLAAQQDGFVYLKDYLYRYKGEMPENARIEIPAGTKGIVHGAFVDQENLREVVIPEGIVFFGDSIFTRCSALATVTLPSDMKEIPTGMFRDCTSLKSITLPQELTSIGSGAFSGSGLESISIPASVRTLASAFTRCRSLKEISFPKGVEDIGGSINDCSALERVFIPASVKEIDGYPFWGCDSLTHVFYEGSAISELEAVIKNLDVETLPMLRNLPIYCYSEEKPTEEGLYWHYVDGKPTPWETEE